MVVDQGVANLYQLLHTPSAHVQCAANRTYTVRNSLVIRMLTGKDLHLGGNRVQQANQNLFPGNNNVIIHFITTSGYIYICALVAYSCVTRIMVHRTWKW